ncbi:MAG TPA: hypothetical protein VF884_15150 [Nitrososphaeraceae archaeon]
MVIAFVSAIFASLITSPVVSVAGVHDNGNQKSKDKPKDPKCNIVKILVKVSKIPKGSKIVIAQATLDGKTVSKTQNVQGDNKVALPLSFKKLSPCPVVGDGFSGDVNGTSFAGTLASLKKPNKVNAALS